MNLHSELFKRLYINLRRFVGGKTRIIAQSSALVLGPGCGVIGQQFDLIQRWRTGNQPRRRPHVFRRIIHVRDEWNADAEGLSAPLQLLQVLQSDLFRREIEQFSGNDYRDLGKIVMEV